MIKIFKIYSLSCPPPPRMVFTRVLRSACRGDQGSDTLEQELQAVRSHLTWVLETRKQDLSESFS